MNVAKLMTAHRASQAADPQPAMRPLRPEAAQARRTPLTATDAFKGASFGAKIGGALGGAVCLATLITPGIPNKLLVVTGIAAASTAVMATAGAIASGGKTEVSAALRGAAFGGVIAGVAAGIATKNVGKTAFAVFSGAMLAGIVGNGVGETLKRPH